MAASGQRMGSASSATVVGSKSSARSSSTAATAESSSPLASSPTHSQPQSDLISNGNSNSPLPSPATPYAARDGIAMVAHGGAATLSMPITDLVGIGSDSRNSVYCEPNPARISRVGSQKSGGCQETCTANSNTTSCKGPNELEMAGHTRPASVGVGVSNTGEGKNRQAEKARRQKRAALEKRLQALNAQHHAAFSNPDRVCRGYYAWRRAPCALSLP